MIQIASRDPALNCTEIAEANVKLSCTVIESFFEIYLVTNPPFLNTVNYKFFSQQRNMSPKENRPALVHF